MYFVILSTDISPHKSCLWNILIELLTIEHRFASDLCCQPPAQFVYDVKIELKIL